MGRASGAKDISNYQQNWVEFIHVMDREKKAFIKVAISKFMNNNPQTEELTSEHRTTSGSRL